MAEHATLPDYATMQRALRRVHETDLHDGVQCPYPGCHGTLVRQAGGFVCDDCGHDPTER